MSRWSVATYTPRAPLSRARSATRTTMGLPPISASAFPGNRLDANRAGIMAGEDMRRNLGGRLPPHSLTIMGERRVGEKGRIRGVPYPLKKKKSVEHLLIVTRISTVCG